MPEGDTVWLACLRLREALQDRVITASDFRTPALATASVTGSIVRDVVPIGKHMLMRFDDGRTLHSHFRMDGTWHLLRPEQRWPAPGHAVRVVLRTDDGVALGIRLHDIRLIPTAHEKALVGHLGPDILAPTWDAEAAASRMRETPLAEIGMALLDQHRVAGIGNLYRNEVLFLHGRHPWTPVADVPDLADLLQSAHLLMDRNKAHWSQATTGETVRGREHYVFERGKRPCRRCGTAIRVALQGQPPRQRLTYWCPSCQPPAALRH